MKIEELKKRYQKLAKKHPRIDFQLVNKITFFVKNHPKRNEGISVNQISLNCEIKSGKARNYCLNYLIPHNYISIHKKGNSRMYPVLITSTGAYKSSKDFNKELEESCALIIDFFNQNPNKLPKEMIDDFNKLKLSIANEKPNIGIQEKLIKILWANKININCATFRRTNYLFY